MSTPSMKFTLTAEATVKKPKEIKEKKIKNSLFMPISKKKKKEKKKGTERTAQLTFNSSSAIIKVGREWSSSSSLSSSQS